MSIRILTEDMRISGLPYSVSALSALVGGAIKSSQYNVCCRRAQACVPVQVKRVVRSMPVRDKSLRFLSSCTSEELEPLEGALLEGQVSCDLCSYPAYNAYSPDRTKYVGEMCRELQLFGGNSIANFFRGGKGVPYVEIVRDVADSLGVSNYGEGIEGVERRILNTVLEKAWEKMSVAERQSLLSAMSGGEVSVAGLSASSLMAVFQMGGFTSYQISVIVANAIARAIVGHGLSFAVNASLCKVLSIVTGPIGWVVGGIWSVANFASPAYRVTVPAVVYIAALRAMKMSVAGSRERQAA